MKKKMILLIGTTLTLVSCNNITSVPQIKDGKDTILVVESKNITRQDLFKEDYISKGYDIALKQLDKEWLEINYASSKNALVKAKVDSARSTFLEENNTKELEQEKYASVSAKDYDEYISLNDELYTIQKEIAIKDYVNKNIIKEKEIKASYDDQKVGGNYRHILIAPDYKAGASKAEIKKANEVALKQAKDVIAKLNKKEKFEDLAKKYSDDDLTKNNGGDLGYVAPSDSKYPTNMVVEMTSYDKDEYSKTPIQTKYGYEIVLKYAVATKKPYEEVKESLYSNKYNSLNSTRTGLEDYAMVQLRKKYGAKFSDPVFVNQYKTSAKKIENDYDFVPKTSQTN